MAAVVVALPAADHPVNAASSEDQAHATLAYLGEELTPDEIAAVQAELAQCAAGLGAQADTVSGRGTLGPNGADVHLIDGKALGPLRDAVLQQPTVMALEDANRTHPVFVPHVTLGYPDAPALGELATGDEIPFDRLALWAGDDKAEFALGGGAGAADADPAETEADPGLNAEADPSIEPPIEDDDELDVEPIPWHGVLTIEGAPSGDGRTFSQGALRERDLPLPLQYVKEMDEGHKNAVVVARIDTISREDMGDGRTKVWGSGFFNDTPEADHAIGQLADGSLRGVSVDVDDATFEADDQGEDVTITSGRVAGATMVPIPAFQEAYVSLGANPADRAVVDGDDIAGEDDLEPDDFEPDEALVADAGEFARGKGWVTHPAATRRIHDYWTRPGQPGFIKVRFGTPNDFYRLRRYLSKYIPAEYLNRTAAQWHHDAIGIWPGQEGGGRLAHALEDAAPALSLVAAAGERWIPNGELFQNPNLTEETALTIEQVGDDLHVYGHAFTWDACHTKFQGMCIAPPPSPTNYARFHCGVVETTLGEQLAGQITVGIPHASERASAKVAAAHYDNTTAAVADVAFGEDAIGGWFSGVIRPWAKPEQIHELRASGVVSGDWRDFGNGLDLIAVLGVNVGGFNTMRAKAHSQNGHQVSLVAAGMLAPAPEPTFDERIEAAVSEVLARRESSLAILQLSPTVMPSPSEGILALAAQL